MKTIFAFLGFALMLLAPAAASASTFEFRLVVDCAPGHLPLPYAINNIDLNICVDDSAFLTAADIQGAGDVTDKIPNRDQTGIPNLHGVLLDLTPQEAARITQVTGDNSGEQLAIMLDGRIVSLMAITVPVHTAHLAVQIPMEDAPLAALLTQFGPPRPSPALEIRAAIACVPGGAHVIVPNSLQDICIANDAVLSDGDVVTVERAATKQEPETVKVTLTPAGKAKLAAFNKAKGSHALAVLVNGEIAETPVIKRLPPSSSFALVLDPLSRDALLGHYPVVDPAL
jgi:preprotein translocase subunit SecD